MFIQSDERTHIRLEHISAIDFGALHANVRTIGNDHSYRVTNPAALHQLRVLVGLEQDAPVLESEIAPKPARKRT